MATVTVTDVLTKTVNATAKATTSAPAQRAPSQAGILEHANPADYDPKNPITVFIIQAAIILIFCRILHWPLSKIRQPRVIAEVIGGILLGPSVMGRIPNFTNSIFPAASMPNLTLAANLGLILFLFLVGLEVDLRFLIKHWRVALSVGAAGMALPFGLGCAIAYGIYQDFRHEPGTVSIKFPIYMLFIGVAMAITAFPVLCRILTELKLLSTPVGVITLSAGVSNDVVGWILLALCVALVNAGSGITALYVLLVALGFVLFLVFAVRPVFLVILRRTRSIEDGPSQSVVALTLFIALASAFFTGIIGIHPIFGAFLAGLICPHEGGFAIKVTEKVEDLVSTLLLPLYFALSGLSTNLGLLNNGITWGYVIGIIAVAFFGKMIGGSGAARANGLVWRECFTIGSLMSCKGLVELIVLNIGLQAKILSVRTFTMFVVMALITTFATTPLVSYLYPPSYQAKLEAWKRGEIDWNTGHRLSSSPDDGSQDSVQVEKLDTKPFQKFLVYLRLDSLPTTLAVVALLGGADNSNAKHQEFKDEDSFMDGATRRRRITSHGLRLLQLTERDSSVMKVSEVSEYTPHDPVVNTFIASGFLYGISTTGEVAIAPEAYYATALASKARENSSDFLILPWSESGSMSEAAVVSSEDNKAKLASTPFNAFVREAFEAAQGASNVGVLINNCIDLTGGSSRLSGSDAKGQEIVVPFMGTRDDCVALRLALQLARNPHVYVRVWNVSHSLDETGKDVLDEKVESAKKTHGGAAVVVKTSEKQQTYLDMLQASLPTDLSKRITFDQVSNNTGALNEADFIASMATSLMQREEHSSALFLLGRNAKIAAGSLRRVRTGDTPSPTSCLGIFADRILLHQARSNKTMETVKVYGQRSLLVVQARTAQP